MSSYMSAGGQEYRAQPQAQYGFAQSACSTSAQHAAPVYGQPQQGVYWQSAASPQVVNFTNTQTPPKSYLGWSIATLVLFFLPLGIVALIFSLGVNTDHAAGRHDEAKRKSSVALILNIVATVLGVVAWIVGVVFIGLYAAASATVYRYYYG